MPKDPPERNNLPESPPTVTADEPSSPPLPDSADLQSSRHLTQPHLTPNQSAREWLRENIPFWKIFEALWIREGRFIKEGLIAVFILMMFACWMGYKISNHVHTEKVDELIEKQTASEKRATVAEAMAVNSDRNLQLAMQRKNDLELTVAPLLARAAKDFPGEEINNSLKKIVAKLSNPYDDPLISMAITAKVIVANNKPEYKSSLNIGGSENPMDSAATIVLAAGSHAIVAASTANLLVDSSLNHKFLFECAADAPFMGEKIRSLNKAEFIQLIFPKDRIPEKTEITGGEVIFVINGNISLTFSIPSQIIGVGKGARTSLYIKEIKEGLEPLAISSE